MRNNRKETSKKICPLILQVKYQENKQKYENIRLSIQGFITRHLVIGTAQMRLRLGRSRNLLNVEFKLALGSFKFLGTSTVKLPKD